ncbi:hypothetical protein M8R20_13440 [Pseudomonas sp. R2.Fl]|nr:hypothetical protein [Pseudomonas sp. R2.Fl]
MSNATKNTPSTTPDPNVEDPHPGSVSDGTHPEADESKRVRKDGAGVEDEIKRKQAVVPALMRTGDPSGAA